MRLVSNKGEALLPELESDTPDAQRLEGSGGGGPYDGGMDTAAFATKADFAELRADFAEFRGDVKSSVSDLRADLHKADAAHKTWILATVLSVLGTGIAMAAFIVTMLKVPPSPAASAVPPIVITIPGTAQTPSAK